MSQTTEYRPIDCSFYDRLEDVAVRRAEVVLLVSDGAVLRTIRGRIADIFSRDGADWASLQPTDCNPLTIRLDFIEALDGITRPDASEHC
jgi:transcriptional antiterminator Rof (Rho-off)